MITGTLNTIRLEIQGTTYEDEYTAVDDNAHALSATGKFITGIIYLQTNNALFGDEINQRFPVSAGAAIIIDRMNLNKIYVKNASAGSNIVINVFGREVW